ncbi:hypothetical protein U0021_07150 [Moraxella canis]|uniref:SCP2 domain-containing protein n=1 Tax=Moraxella canis TaxID=90239 RepID=A0ABZ0WWP7_9GAMM|nr:hypothetical protein [Moraxella canis]WQE03520.1 hypothetical protein U0021_07150 [Moraxella canis]
MFTLPIINVKTDPLDALLAAIGLRLQNLAKTRDNDSFNHLVKDKSVCIQFTAPDVERYYRFENGHFGQTMGKAQHPDLTIDFKNSMTGAKLLTKGDVAALMTAIQDGDVKVTGDYKLVLWFAGIAKQAATIPEEYRGYIEQAKPLVEAAKPYAKTAKDFIGSVKQKISK